MGDEYSSLTGKGSISRVGLHNPSRRKIFIIAGVILLLVAIAGIVALIVGLAVGLGGKKDDDNANLADRVRVENIMGHLNSLQSIADAANGTRAAISPGYNASVQFIVSTLQSYGYDPYIQTFTISSTRNIGGNPPSLSLTQPANPSNPLKYIYGQDFTSAQNSPSANNFSAPISPVMNYGCLASDFANFPAGSIALVARSPADAVGSDSCSLAQKTLNAQNVSASGVIVYNDAARASLFSATLGEGIFSIPVFTTSFIVGDHLVCASATAGSTLRMFLMTERITTDTYNVIAETDAGDEHSVIVIGAHLDSVPAGPGINDDGSGSATLLEIAIQLAEVGWGKIANPNRIRFCWWGAEELGLIGSTFYVQSLLNANGSERLGNFSDIAAYLNFDMIGSPNYFRGILNGTSAAGVAQPGCAKIQNLFEEDLTLALERLPNPPTNQSFPGWQPSGFGPPYRSDYGPFVTAGIPAGGLFTGAEVVKTMDERKMYGGISGISYDPCYHLACDTVENINQDVLSLFSGSAARMLQKLAQIEDVRMFLNPSNAMMMQQEGLVMKRGGVEGEMVSVEEELNDFLKYTWINVK